MSSSVAGSSERLDGVPYVGKWTLAVGQTLYIPYPFVVDSQQILSEGGPCLEHPEAASAAAFKTAVPAEVWMTFLGRTADLYLTNDAAGPVVVSVKAQQTRIPRAEWVDLPPEGRSAHTGVTVTP